MRFLSAVAVVVCICLCAQVVLADMVYFKDETTLEGQVLSYTKERLKIATTHGVLEFDTVHILKVMRGDKYLIPAPTPEQKLEEKKASPLPWILAGIGGCCVLYFLMAVMYAAGQESN